MSEETGQVSTRRRPDPHRLLDPEEQVSTPWGEPDHGHATSAPAGAERATGASPASSMARGPIVRRAPVGSSTWVSARPAPEGRRSSARGVRA